MTEGESVFYSSPVNFCEIQQFTRREGFGTGYTSKRTIVKLYKTQVFHASASESNFCSTTVPVLWLIPLPNVISIIFKYRLTRHFDCDLVVADFWLSYGNPKFHGNVGLLLVVDVVSLFASAGVWIF